jgi:hypothetical protein
MYANGKWKPIETVPEMGEGGGIREHDGEGEFKCDIN